MADRGTAVGGTVEVCTYGTPSCRLTGGEWAKATTQLSTGSYRMKRKSLAPERACGGREPAP